MTVVRRPPKVQPVYETWKNKPVRLTALAVPVVVKPKKLRLKKVPKPFIIDLEVEREAIYGEVDLCRFSVPIRTRTLNEKLSDHWGKRRWTKEERDATRLLFPKMTEIPLGPWAIGLRRFSPSSRRLDKDDNLPGTLKGVRDEIAKCLGFHDDEDPRLKWRYAQERAADWRVLITITTWQRLQAVEAKGGVL